LSSHTPSSKDFANVGPAKDSLVSTTADQVRVSPS
jgi:hypothetical protein